MVKRTYEKTAKDLVDGEDLNCLVRDKRKEWRASPSRVRKRQRRYENRIVKCLVSEYVIDNN